MPLTIPLRAYYCVVPRCLPPSAYCLLLLAIFAPKKCALDLETSGKSTESTFPIHFSKTSIFPRVAQNTFRSNTIYFPIENSNHQ